MTLQPLAQTDLFSGWLDKLNAAITAINNLNPGANVFSLTSPGNNDILVYNSTSGLFVNMPSAAFITAVLNTNSALAQYAPFNYYLQSQQTLF